MSKKKNARGGARAGSGAKPNPGPKRVMLKRAVLPETFKELERRTEEQGLASIGLLLDKDYSAMTHMTGTPALDELLDEQERASQRARVNTQVFKAEGVHVAPDLSGLDTTDATTTNT